MEVEEDDDDTIGSVLMTISPSLVAAVAATVVLDSGFATTAGPAGFALSSTTIGVRSFSSFLETAATLSKFPLNKFLIHLLSAFNFVTASSMVRGASPRNFRRISTNRPARTCDGERALLMVSCVAS